ncbi:hypothetical protein NECAME_09696 [Necator americanus]|uniref:Uncharacterized protein n=1 Tax=Necator americanus TaxID=51031 RepID=W2TC67_NECAM|nr:hypothetical protein NECAME_09696 [Necator americanus]ETN79650.1 hypothetical protein NECAME_09696 [Necator americanus]
MAAKLLNTHSIIKPILLAIGDTPSAGQHSVPQQTSLCLLQAQLAQIGPRDKNSLPPHPPPPRPPKPPPPRLGSDGVINNMKNK